MRQDLLVVENLSKHYPGVRANDRINFCLAQGSIHAILGENGAGKSTLMHLIYGITQPTSGRILLEGRELKIKNPAHARSLGIEMVFQHCTIFESLDVLDNLYLSSDQSKAALLKELTRVSEHYALNIDPFQSGQSLSLGQKQRLEIIRCLLNKPKLLILDEPTSTLSEKAATSLFHSLRILAQEGCSILYISHKLAEIQGLCDQATILRLGKVVESFDPKQESSDRIAELMLGKKLEKVERDKAAQSEPELQQELQQKRPLFAVKNLSTLAGKTKTHLKNIQFELYPGEILGIAGVSNNGQEELYRALSGEDPYYHGKIYLENKLLPRKNSLERRKKGIYAVPEEKLYRGILPDMSLSANFLLTSAEKDFFSHGFLENPKLDDQTEHCIRDFRVKANSPHIKAKALSGGNLQKFMLGREIVKNPKVLLVFNPTWGIDVRAANFVRSALLKLKQRGCSVILFSEDLDELFSLSDRIAVLFNGKLSPLKEVDAITNRELGLWMAGVPAADPIPA